MRYDEAEAVAAKLERSLGVIVPWRSEAGLLMLPLIDAIVKRIEAIEERMNRPKELVQ